MSAPPLARRALAEFLGTGLRVAVVVGSGLAGALIGAALVLVLHPAGGTGSGADDVVIAHAEPAADAQQPASA